MPELSWTLLSGDLFRDKKADALVRYVFKKMNDECKDGGSGLNSYDFAKEHSTINKAYGQSMIVFFLHEGTQVLSTAFVAWCNQVTYRWTPPKHRGKGYATEILRRIQALYATCPETLLFVASLPLTFNSNKRAGWLPSDGRMNPDGTQDWVPPEKMALYKRRLEHQDAGECSNISDVFCRINQSDWSQKETEAFIRLVDGWGNKRKVVATLRC